MKKIYVILLVFIFFSSGCSWLRGAAKPVDDRVLLVAIDRSRSMHHNDPGRLSVEGSQLLFALAPKNTRVGAVTYSDTTKKVMPVTVLSTRGQREKACNRISEAPLEGTGTLGNAFTDFQKLLQDAGAGKGSNLVIFSDGKFSKEDSETLSSKLTDEFKKGDWRIHTVALTPKTSTPPFASISQGTGGAHFKIEKPQELLRACFHITGEGGNLFAFLGQIGAITVLPKTERLLLVAMRNSAAGGFGSNFTVTQPTGKTKTVTKRDSNLFVFPLTGARDPGFETLNVWDPVAGVWSVGVKPQTEEVYVGCNLPLKLGFEKDRPKSSYFEGELIEIQFSLTTEHKDLFAIIKESGECSVSITRESAPASSPLSVAVTPAFEESKEKGGICKATYTASTQLSLSEPGKPEKCLLTFSIVINCPDGGKWLYGKKAQFKLEPVPLVKIEPEEVNFGTHWVDLITEPLTQEVSLSTNFPGEVTVSLTSVPPSLSVSQTEFKVSGAGGPVKVTITLDTTKPEALGEHKEKLTFTPETPGYPAQKPILPVVTFAMYKFTGSDIAMKGKPGETVKVPLNFATEPGEVSLFSAEPEVTLLFNIIAAPGGFPAKITDQQGQQTLEVDIPPNAPGGEYTGELEIIPSVEGLAHRNQKVTLILEGVPIPTLTPKEILLQANKNGWIETPPVAVTLNYSKSVDVTFERGNLTNSEVGAEVSGEFDTELVGQNGWNMQNLDPAAPGTFTLKIYVSSDLPPAKYEGKLTVRDDAGKQIGELPITLEVSR